VADGGQTSMACSYLVIRLPVAKLDKKRKQKQRKREQNFAKESEKKEREKEKASI
jgi:hypothetical protein